MPHKPHRETPIERSYREVTYRKMPLSIRRVLLRKRKPKAHRISGHSMPGASNETWRRRRFGKRLMRLGASRFVAFQCGVKLLSQPNHFFWVQFSRHFHCDVMPSSVGLHGVGHECTSPPSVISGSPCGKVPVGHSGRDGYRQPSATA